MPSTCCAGAARPWSAAPTWAPAISITPTATALIKAPMHGKVLALLVGNGEQVEKGQRLAIIEAMKMEHALTAPRAGRVAGIAVAAGSQVAEGAKLMTIEARWISDMPLHLIKLSVGTDSIEDLEDWIKLKSPSRRSAASRSPSASTPPAWCPSAPRKSSTAARSTG